jgi:hypothetical protein
MTATDKKYQDNSFTSRLIQGIRPLSKSQIHRQNYVTGESIRIYRVTKLVTGNQSKAHQDASFESMRSEILRSTFTAKAATVQY